MDKICRICTNEGARNIFDKSAKISSLDNIIEKLRYVCLIQIKENDNLPKMICDLCIVQLNVSYNFKRQAVESDCKLRQYLIEKGIGIESEPTTTTTIVPVMSPTTSASLYNSNVDVSTRIQQQLQQPQNTKLPITIIKTEPIEFLDDTSNDTTENHIENRLQRKTQTVTMQQSQQQHAGSAGSTVQSMVIVNDNSLLKQSQDINDDKTIATTNGGNNNLNRDYEFISSYVTHTRLLDFTNTVINPINMIVANRKKQENCENLTQGEILNETKVGVGTTTNKKTTLNFGGYHLRKNNIKRQQLENSNENRELKKRCLRRLVKATTRKK